MKTLKVSYLYNSGFSLEGEEDFLVIDYFKGELDLPEDKNIIFLVSHHHYDHYNKKIFDYEDRARYILSFDIDDKEPGDRVYFMDIGDELRLGNVLVRTLGSTDEGSSFYLELDGFRIFHGGDLNWWAWDDQGPAKELERERSFKREIAKLDGREVDLVFAPVDPRLGKNYYLGGAYIIERLRPAYFFPMHFREDYSRMDSFIHRMRAYDTRILRIGQENQVFIVGDQA